jgi:4'-phosphopantetheinyl transferase
MRELGPLQIDLWQYLIGEPPDARHLAHALVLLNDTEKSRAAAFHFEKHRAAYTISHAMLRVVLSEYAPVRPEEWQFLAGPWGKPEIAAPALDTPLWFNLSHTDGCAVCVAGRVSQLGVDVENLNRKTSHDELARHYFAAEEYDYLRNLAPHRQREAFFRIWTLKEAYIKAEGKGLSIPLASFSFHFSAHNPAQVMFESSSESNSDHWSFYEFQPAPDYRISLAARNAGYAAFHVERLDATPLLNG